MLHDDARCVLGHGADRGPRAADPVRDLLDWVGAHWTVPVLTALGDGRHRFSEIEKLVSGISAKMLTQTLRSAEREGFVTRTVFSTSPPHVEYGLTELGGSLLALLEPVEVWATARFAEIDLARATFDRRVVDAVAGPAGGRSLDPAPR